jgi:DHA1 family solute carrier family 18 vesicular amine transporter 1/2
MISFSAPPLISARTSPAVTLALVTAAILMDMLLYGMVVPILPGYMQSLGASQAAVGVLFACYAISLLLATPALGWLADRLGRRGPMLGGLLGLAATTLLFAFADSFSALVTARLLQGLAAAATWTAGLALVADVFPSERRGQAMGTAMSGMVAGALLGPPFGGLLYQQGGYRLPFLVTAAGALALALSLALLLAEPKRRQEPQPGLLDLVRDRMILAVSGAIVLAALALTLLEPTLPLYLSRELHVSPAAVGLLFALSTMAFGAISPAAGRLADRLRGESLVALGIAALAATLPLLPLPGTLFGVSMILALIGLASGLILTPALPLLAERVDLHGGGAYGSVYAIFNLAYAVGMIAGPVIGGVLAQTLGFAAALAMGSLLLLLYLPLLLSRRRQH